jgi:UDP-N-acetylglucosamine diphosphorylase / glucose-1-phosphate thymidylyltransferase / UDP-N-acetylgalactosamine diphosphorylase / glucosamine-1-phosphate N-acetyltransferase / galactosamine-1-phosphate N-acetyltransferase
MPDSVISKAVILAAGKGTRMGTITAETPKPMLLVHGKPLLEHILEGLAVAGVSEFAVVVGYHHEMIEAHFQNWRFPIHFLLQENVNGTGSAVRLTEEFVSKDSFLLTYGDILCAPAAYTRCAESLLQNTETVAVLGVKEVDDPWRGAAVYENGGRITQVIEKPPQGTSTTRWNSAGLYALQPIAFSYLSRVQPSPRGEYELTSIFSMMLEDRLDLRIAPVTEDWRDVGTPEDLNAANQSK